MIPRIQLLIGFLCLALLFYFVMLTRTAVALLRTGTPAAVALGIGVLLLPIVGAWATVATLRAGLAQQRLARLAAEDGMELDVSALPTRPRAGSSATPPTRCSRPSAPRSRPTRRTGAGGTGWPGPMTTPAIGPGRARRCAKPWRCRRRTETAE